jgi:hypothetical protein
MPIIIETRQGGKKAEEQLPLGDHELGTAIGKLDGRQTTALTIAIGGDVLLIGGGAGSYVVTGWMAGEEPRDLVGDPQAAGEVPLVVGGQLGSYPARLVVTSERALKVAKCFSKTGHMDAGEVWEGPG